MVSAGDERSCELPGVTIGQTAYRGAQDKARTHQSDLALTFRLVHRWSMEGRSERGWNPSQLGAAYRIRSIKRRGLSKERAEQRHKAEAHEPRVPDIPTFPTEPPS
jgi:hypothetical protein